MVLNVIPPCHLAGPSPWPLTEYLLKVAPVLHSRAAPVPAVLLGLLCWMWGISSQLLSIASHRARATRHIETADNVNPAEPSSTSFDQGQEYIGSRVKKKRKALLSFKSILYPPI